MTAPPQIRMPFWLCAMSAIALALFGCSTTHHKLSADRETYGIIQGKDGLVPGMEETFTLEAKEEWDPLLGLPTLTDSGPPLGPGASKETGRFVLSLGKALNIAVHSSRRYRDEKEALYLAALELTLERHRYTPIFSAGASGEFARFTRDVPEPSDFSNALTAANGVLDTLESVTGTAGELLSAYASLVESAGALGGATGLGVEAVNERSISGQTSIGVSRLLKGGGQFALTLTSDFLRFLTGGSRVATSSALVATFTQPLLRGRGSAVSAEQLTQSERDVLYSLRDYTRFRKEFVVLVSTEYYRVLQNKNVAQNNWGSYQNFLESLERERALAREGRRTQADVGRIEQAALNNRRRWVNSVQRYEDSLDRFRIQLGLPTRAPIVLDDGDLESLHANGIEHPDISSDDAITVALATRLDLLTEHDRVEDASRKVQVAADALKPALDLILAANLNSTGRDNFQELDFNRGQLSGGFDLDLPLDRKAERNAYRAALIAYERAIREYSLAEDNVKLDVRVASRNLEQARLNYEIAQNSVDVSDRRVREQEVLAEVGRGTAIDLVDAQNDLTSAQNDLTAALVTHTVTRLAFWRDMGILYIKKNGQWVHEIE